jgi:uncharacterized membrane protein
MALGDGVFAIAMTLLVFQLGVPAATSGDRLAAQLIGMWPDFAMYAMSFLVLGVFWLIHHVLFDIVERYDTTLIWLNIAFLLFAALVPFSTSLFAEHGATTETAIFYGLNMITVFATGWGIFVYSTAGRRLVGAGVEDAVIRGGRTMGLVYMLYMLPSTLMAFAAPIVSFCLFGLGVATIIGSTLIGKAEVVLLWRDGRSR